MIHRRIVNYSQKGFLHFAHFLPLQACGHGRFRGGSAFPADGGHGRAGIRFLVAARPGRVVVAFTINSRCRWHAKSRGESTCHTEGVIISTIVICFVRDAVSIGGLVFAGE